MLDHFVITYDTETKKLDVDDETACNRFPGGLMYDTGSSRWLNQQDFPNEDMEAFGVVKAVVELYNQVLRKLKESSP